jgi:hypothetical protein
MTVLTIATESYEKQHQINSNPTVHIEQSTLEYLHTAFLLYEYKQTHSKREYRALLEEYGWDKGSAEEKRSLKIAEHYQAFVGCPEHLAVLPISVLLRLCTPNYKVLIEELQGFSNLNCQEVLELIDERRVFLKSQNREEKEGNWRATSDGSRYYTFGKIMEDDHQTGVLTEKLILQMGLSPQRIVRMAISDLYEKQQTEIGKDEIDDFVESSPVEEDLTRDSEETVNEINWESKQEEFETLWQRDAEESEEYTCSDSEYLEEPEEVNSDLEDEEIEVGENTQTEIKVINKTPVTDAEILADILRQASDYADVRRGLYQYQPVKEEAWKMLSDLERKSVCQMLPEPIKKLSHAKREGLIVNFCEVESGGVYKIFTADCPLIEKIVSTYSLDRLLEELRVRQNCECN